MITLEFFTRKNSFYDYWSFGSQKYQNEKHIQSHLQISFDFCTRYWAKFETNDGKLSNFAQAVRWQQVQNKFMWNAEKSACHTQWFWEPCSAILGGHETFWLPMNTVWSPSFFCFLHKRPLFRSTMYTFCQQADGLQYDRNVLYHTELRILWFSSLDYQNMNLYYQLLLL